MLGNFFRWLSNPEEVAEFLADTTVCLLIFYIIYLIRKVLKLIMDSLKGFFKGNAKQVENEKVVISDRFVGDDGKPLEWEIRAIGNETDDELRNQCTSQVRIKKNVYVPKLDYTEYLKKLLTSCVVQRSFYLLCSYQVSITLWQKKYRKYAVLIKISWKKKSKKQKTNRGGCDGRVCTLRPPQA